MRKSAGKLFGHRQLERSLQQKIDEELQTADSGDYQAAELEEKAKRIHNLQDLAHAAHLASPLRRVEKAAVLGLFVIALLVITFLVFTRVKTTNVETELKVSEAMFVLAKDSPILQPMNVTDVQIFDARSITITAQKKVSLDAPEGAVARILGVSNGPKNSAKFNRLSLPGLSLPKGTTVSIKASEAGRFRLAVTLPPGHDPPMELTLTGRGSLSLFLVGDNTNSTTSVDLDSPYAIQVVPLKREFNLDFSILPDTSLEFLPQIPISDTSFHQEDAESKKREVSAIDSGYLIRTELGNEKLDLRPFEPLNLRGCRWDESQRCLVLRRLTMSRDGIVAQFYGNVNEMKAGPTGAERDLMPSLLEWSNSNHHLKVLWTAFLFASGLIFGVIRWVTRGA